MKIINKLTAVVCAASMMTSSMPCVCAEADISYRQIQDYAIFNGTGNINWCGGNNLEVVSSKVPVDSNVTYNGTPSLRVNVTDKSDWWTVRLVVRSWMSMDFLRFQPSGRLEFDIKGNAGGERFTIGFADNISETDEEDIASVSISDYTTVTTDWQHISIPLSDISAANKDVDLSDITLLYLKNDGTTDSQKFWITNIEVTSDESEPESPPIKVNQVGFHPEGTKYALVSFYPELYNICEGDKFSVCDSATGEAVYIGSLKLLSEFDERDSGEKVFRADFSDFEEQGRYYISVDGLEKSVNFSIADNVYAEALTAAQKYFYYQRQGTALDEKYAEKFARDDLDINDSAVTFSSGKTGTVDSQKGWFDAGDSGKYVNTGAGAVSTLLWAYEMYPEYFTDNSLNIPESGNGIPDVLDEARWELEWILTMQNTESGGFYPRIQGDAGDRSIMDKNGCTTDDTACAVGVLAESYLVYREIDAEFAEKCLEAAKKGWEFLSENPSNIQSYDVYVVSDDIPDRLWAAGALYRANSDKSCREYFEENCQKLKEDFEESYTYGNRWGDNWLTGCWNYLLCDVTDENTNKWLVDEIDIWRDVLLTTKWEKNIWGVPLHKGNYFRGITLEICNMAMGLTITDRILNLNDSRTAECTLSSLSWLLGSNPLGISYVTGCGENSINTIYSQIYESDGIDEVPDGYMPQGPNYTALKTYSKFAAKCYINNQNDWVCNEHTVYGNASLVYLLAAAADEGNIEGDVNADGEFTMADLVMLEKYILGTGTLNDWQAGDMYKDNVIDAFDLVVMRRKLIE